MIILHSVTKQVGKWGSRKTVLNDVSWVISPRSRVVVLGQKGSGKTTLLSMINGTIFPTKGWVERKGSIAFGRIMQGRSGFDRTPRQIANRVAMLYRTDPDEVVQFVGNFAQMKHLMDFRIAELPKNYQLGFNIALFYAIPFDFYLFDGSTFPRKGDLSERCREALEMRSQEATVIFATSDARAALQFGGTAALLYNGALTHYGSVKDAVAVYRRLPPPKRDTRFLPKRESPEEADEENSWL